MKKIKYSIFFTALLSLAACSDDNSLWQNSELPEGALEFSISVPDAQKVITRAEDYVNERKINDLTVLFFDQDGNVLQQTDLNSSKLSSNDGEGDYATKFVIMPEANLKSYSGNVTAYVVANASDKIGRNYSGNLSALNIISDNSDISTRSNGFVMSGKSVTGKLDALRFANVTLNRTAAKISVETEANDKTKDFLAGAFQIKNAADAGYITAGVTDSKVSASSGASDFSVGYQYVYPTEADNAFIILKGYYNEHEGYYRIDLYKDGEALAIKPNYWYEVHIVSVTEKGYSSPEEAAQHSMKGIVAEIHDHAPEVYSMVSDGYRELGTPLQIIHKGDATTLEQGLTVKYYSKFAEDYSKDIKVEVLEGGEWLSVGEGSDASSDNSYDGDSDTPGKKMSYPLTFKASSQTGLLSGKVKVSWCDFSREVIIVWDSDFDPSKICSAVLNIKDTDSGSTYSISDYWTFLAGKGSGTSKTGSPKLWGAGVADNPNGNIRNRGFHFPVMYGKQENNKSPWTYEYTVTLSEASFKNRSFDYKVETADDNKVTSVVITGATGSHTANAAMPSFTLTKSGDNYENQEGSLVITISYTDGDRETEKYPLALYHTGFFHYDSYNHRVDTKPSAAYYYYEVVSVGNKHWLDRNLGAKSSGMNVIDENGHSINSALDSNSTGGYYLPAAYEAYANVEEKLFSDLCPPGYRIPTTNEWDNLRNSVKFNTELNNSLSTAYFNSYYTLDNGENLYFPKGRYYNGTVMNGVDRAGYYWTSTAAKGTEKEEIGRYLQALFISGESNGYIFGNVQSFGMSVRCVDKVADNTAKNVVSFRVRGATHVYLYRITEDGKKLGLTSWPGKAIGSPDVMRKDFFFFMYDSQYKDTDLKVVFNFMNENGRIITLAENSMSAATDFDHAVGFSFNKNSVFDFKVNETARTWSKGNDWSVNATPTQTVYKYYLTGSSFGWSDKEMTYSNGKWSITTELEGSFGIRRENAESLAKDYIWSKNGDNVVLNSAMPCILQSGENGINWNNLPKGNYTIVFDPSAYTVTVSKNGGGENPSLGETIRYRVYWYNDFRTQLAYKIGTSSQWNYKTPEGKESTPNGWSDQRNYVTIEVSASETKLEVAACDSSHQNMYALSSDGAKNIIGIDASKRIVNDNYDYYVVLY